VDEHFDRTLAIVMAGGRSERMRRTRGPTHKALVPLSGMPLVEWNIRMLVAQGFHHLVLVIGNEPELERYGLDRAEQFAADGVQLSTFKEAIPLGQIGALRLLANRADHFLVTYADNITTLDLRSLLHDHLAHGAPITLACHVQIMQLSYGTLEVMHGEVLSYDEKPSLSYRVSSGTCCLSATAAKMIPEDRPTNVHEFVAHLKRRGDRIRAYEHSSLWIDVNDAAALADAERMVSENMDIFQHAVDLYARF
jgi:NDP-mannose synthase